MSNSVQSLAVRHPEVSYALASTVFAITAISPTPVFLPVVALLACIRLSAFTFINRPDRFVHGAVQAFLVSVAGAATHLAPSLGALSTPSTSLVILSFIMLFTSSLAFGVVFATSYAVRSIHNPWAKLTLLPAVWASAWGFVSYVSPVGQLVTWSPVLGLGPYLWVRQVSGQWGIDWIAAAWAVVLSEIVGSWVVGHDDQEGLLVDTEPLLIDHGQIPTYHSIETTQRDSQPQTKSKSSASSRDLLILTTGLLLLILPSYGMAPYLPLPINSPATATVNVACALPGPPQRGHGNPSLKDYMSETLKLQSFADIILWPESALRFNSPEERESAFEEIQKGLQGKRYVGIGFEDHATSERGDGQGKGYNVFALIQNTGPPILEYYKRMLVPIAESFSLSPGNGTPHIVDLAVGKHSIPVTASICLDFASTATFTGLDTRPAFILAPAKTWHVGVGYAMWEQAKARAAETGSTVIWCDGGKGGISGIASGSYSEVVQVGSGSWSKKIAFEYPFDSHRTFYLQGGQIAMFAIVWAICGLGSFGELTVGRFNGRWLLALARRGVNVVRFRNVKRAEERPLLD